MNAYNYVGLYHITKYLFKTVCHFHTLHSSQEQASVGSIANIEVNKINNISSKLLAIPKRMKYMELTMPTRLLWCYLSFLLQVGCMMTFLGLSNLKIISIWKHGTSFIFLCIKILLKTLSDIRGRGDSSSITFQEENVSAAA